MVDSRNLFSAQALLALEGARLAREGCTGREIAERLRAETAKAQSSFLLDRLDYMRLKPCIPVRDGAMGVVKKYRSSFEHCMAQYTRELLAV